MKVYSFLKLAWDGSVVAEESYDYDGEVVFCKGASSAETALQQSQTNLTNTLQQDFSTTFAGQQNILNSLSSSLGKIQAAGPSQQGYTQAQLNALNTQASTGVAQNYQNAARAVAATAATAGGGNVPLPTGATLQNAQNVANAAAGQQSNELLGIQNANYAQGNANYNNAVSGLLSTSGQLNPNQYANSATSSGNSAFNEANTIAQQNNAASPWNAIGGALGGIAGSFLGPIGASVGSKLTGLFTGSSGSGGDSWASGAGFTNSSGQWDPGDG